jgi:hypothetical protein
MGFFLAVSGGVISSRIASNTTLNCASRENPSWVMGNGSWDRRNTFANNHLVKSCDQSRYTIHDFEHWIVGSDVSKVTCDM